MFATRWPPNTHCFFEDIQLTFQLCNMNAHIKKIQEKNTINNRNRNRNNKDHWSCDLLIKTVGH